MTGTFGDKRDIGVQAGSTKIELRDFRLEYAVGVFNGSGPNTPENNDNGVTFFAFARLMK